MSGEIIQGLDPIDIMFFMRRKNKKHLAILLDELEEVLGADNPLYPQVRKLVLDSFNSYTRSVRRVIFGNDFEN